MKLNKRLQVVADLVDKDSYILDVGCDHALLDIYLVNKKIGVHPTASDIAQGPLEQARKNIALYHMEDEIKLEQGNGIENLDSTIDTVVISGMGGRTIYGILKNHQEKLSTVKTLILSPNSDIALLRSFLCHHGFYIDEEQIVEDHRIFYIVLKFKRGKKKYQKRELYFGPILLQKKDGIFTKYLQNELQKKHITWQLLPRKYWFKRYKLQKEIQEINKILK